MTHFPSGAAGAAPAHARAESLVARYPALDPAELAELKRWFNGQASALDIGLLASNERIAPQYRRFRSDHLDTLGWRDFALIAAVSVMLVGGVVAAMVMN